jgi:hypothetical protein
MTEETTMPGGDRITSDNPWHHMKGIQKSVRIPGKILPKRLLRPYFYEHPYRINDKQYVIASISSLKDGLHFVYGSLYIIAGGAALGWSATRFQEHIALSVVLICLAIAIPLQKYGKTLKRDRFRIYDREKGTVRREYGWFKLKYHEMTFWDSEAYLVSGSNQMGLMRHMLFLFHPSGQSFMVTEGADYDWPLGYWSFLLQYMDKSKPLPDILSLKHYPDKEPGLGDWKSWKEKIAKREVIDPYLVWEAQLEKHPEWDVGNYGRDLSKSWRPQFYFALSVFGVLIFIGTAIAYFTI